jgi:hypothetical protein
MNRIEEAYLDGFFKRAAAYGLSVEQAAAIFEKSAAPQAVAPKAATPKAVTPNAVTPKAVAPNPAAAKAIPKTMVGEGDKNDRAASMGNYVPKPLPKTIPLEY